MATQAERDEARFRRIVDSNPPVKAFQKTDESQRKPLFGRAGSMNNTVEKGFFGGVQRDVAQVGGTEDATKPASRIPRRSSQSPEVTSRSSPFRRGGSGAIKLTEAWKKTAPEGEQDIFGIQEKQGSPSPAPRLRPKARSREDDERRMAKLRDGFKRSATAPLRDARQKSIDEDLTTGTSASGGSLPETLGNSIESNDSMIERKLSQYEKDLARKEAILKPQTSLLAKKDQVLTRKSSASSLEGEPIAGQRRSDWGRKARIGTGWMRKIVSPDDSGELVEVPALPAHNTSVDWAGAAADVPLASVEDDSSIQEPTPPHSRPSSAQPYSVSPQKSQTSETDLDFSVDFTAKSVLYSNSPALHVRGSKIDEVRQREIESLNKRAVATSRLEDIRERNSAERSASPEVTRSPAKEGSLRSTTSQSSLRRESELSSRVESVASLSRRESARSLRKDSPERVMMSEVLKTGAIEVQSAGNPQSLHGDSHRRSISKEGITAALTPGPMLRRTSSPNESSVRLGESKGAKDEVGAAMPPNIPSFPKVEQDNYGEKTILEEEGEHIPGTPITIFYGAAKDKPPHKKGGSWEDLQKLSRLLSESPVESSEQKKPKEASSKLSNVIPLDIKRLSATSTPPKSDVDPEERIAAEASLFDLPENNKSERNSLRAPSPDDYSDGVDQTPVPKPDPLTMPTPVVTGAYIDTPAPTVRQSRRSTRGLTPDDFDESEEETARVASNLATRDFVRSQRAESSQSRTISSPFSRDGSGQGPLSSHPVNSNPRGRSAGRFRPRLVNTANPASVADDLRKIQQEAQIEDSTLDDFDELLAMDDDSDPNSTTMLGPAIDFEKDERGRPLSEKERERRLEAATYERLNKGLKNGLLSIRDAKRGIERLEDRVSLSSDFAASVLDSNKLRSVGSAPYDSNVVTYIAIPVPRLWTWDVTKRWGFHLTWFGIIVGFLLSWFMMETVTCEFICRPKYAIINNWQPGDPEWGLALPTLFDRWTGGLVTILGPLIQGLLKKIWALWTDSDIKQTGETVLNAGREVYNNWEGGSMFEDEAL